MSILNFVLLLVTSVRKFSIYRCRNIISIFFCVISHHKKYFVYSFILHCITWHINTGSPQNKIDLLDMLIYSAKVTQTFSNISVIKFC